MPLVPSPPAAPPRRATPAWICPLLLLVGGLGAGCAQEVYLMAAPEPTPSPRPSQVGLPVPPRPPQPGPWDDLEPGNLPDLRFVTGWSDWDCSSAVDGGGWRDLWGGCLGGIAIVDLRGQVLLEVDLSAVLGETLEPWMISGLGVHPAGPGKVLFTLRVDSWTDDAELSEFWEWPHAAVLFDAWEGTSEVVARWRPWADDVWLPSSGRILSLPTRGGFLQVLPWPGTSELAIWQAGWDCASPGLDVLWRIDPRDPDWLRGRWEGAALGSTGGVQPLIAGAGPLGDSLVFVRSGMACGESPTAGTQLTWWSPEGGPAVIDTVAAWNPWAGMSEVSVSLDGSAALLVPYPQDGVLRWHLVDRDGAVTGLIEDSGAGARPGPLLDPAGPTFALLLPNASGTGERVEIHHRGARVWSVDQLIFGLAAREKFLVGVTPLLPPL